MPTFHENLLMEYFSIYDCSGKKYASDYANESDYAIYGAGVFGEDSLQNIANNGLPKPCFFVDGNKDKYGEFVKGIEIVSPQKLMDLKGDIPIGMGLTDYYEDYKTAAVIEAPLRELGFSSFFRLMDCSQYRNHINRQAVLETVNMLADKKSKETYCAYIFQRLFECKFTGDWMSHVSQYIDSDIYGFKRGDHVVDCGAYDGDSVQRFTDASIFVSHVSAFEPGEAIIPQLEHTAQDLREKGRSVSTHNFAVCNHNGEMCFSDSANAGSHISTEEGGITVSSCRLDDFTFSTPPSFIKMDIEGAELDALKGSENIIREHRPILAICIYHKPEDLHEIPEYIRSIVPDYKLFVRKYDWNVWELVLYAVPPERALI